MAEDWARGSATGLPSQKHFERAGSLRCLKIDGVLLPIKFVCRKCRALAENAIVISVVDSDVEKTAGHNVPCASHESQSIMCSRLDQNQLRDDRQTRV